jgi:hypothetical protein
VGLERLLVALEGMQLFMVGVAVVREFQQGRGVQGGRVYGVAVVDRVDSPPHKLQQVVLPFLVAKVGGTEEVLDNFRVEAVREGGTPETEVRVQQGTSE